MIACLSYDCMFNVCNTFASDYHMIACLSYIYLFNDYMFNDNNTFASDYHMITYLSYICLFAIYVITSLSPFAPVNLHSFLTMTFVFLLLFCTKITFTRFLLNLIASSDTNICIFWCQMLECYKWKPCTSHTMLDTFMHGCRNIRTGQFFYKSLFF